MNSKHLAKGSQCPPPPKGDMITLYNMRFCPYAQRPVLVAIAKNIPHEIVNCNLKDKPEWIFAKNPAGKVPILERPDGKIIYESLIISDYLDESFPNCPLNSEDPFQKAWDRVWIEEFNKVITVFYKMAVNLKPGGADAIVKANIQASFQEFQQSLEPFEKELAKRGTTFFGGQSGPGFLDYMIWPWIERVPAIKLFSGLDSFDFEAAKKANPHLEAWRTGMKADDAVKQYLVSPEIHGKFIQSHFAGKADYDLLLNQ